MGVHVALLRGVNVGGNNRVPMKSLAPMFVEAGCGDVKTYIQSGNVVFTATDALARRIPAAIGKALRASLGFQVPVVMRTAAEVGDVAGNNPFLRAGADPGTLHVAFLGDPPGAAEVAALDPDRSPPDRFKVVGREVYLHYPGGLARTRLTNEYLGAKLRTTSTVRNWRTVLKLLELISA